MQLNTIRKQMVGDSETAELSYTTGIGLVPQLNPEVLHMKNQHTLVLQGLLENSFWLQMQNFKYFSSY